MPHEPRETFTPNLPLIITVRVHQSVPYLRSPKALKIVTACIRAARERLGMRLTQYSIQGNHIHFIVEAKDRVALARAMKGLCVRIARRLNRAYGRKGQVFADRFHSRVLRDPWQVISAIHYVKDNSRIHAARRKKRWRHDIDPFAGGPCPKSFFDSCRALIAEPRSFLLRVSWGLPLAWGVPWLRRAAAPPGSRRLHPAQASGPLLAREPGSQFLGRALAA